MQLKGTKDNLSFLIKSPMRFHAIPILAQQRLSFCNMLAFVLDAATRFNGIYRHWLGPMTNANMCKPRPIKLLARINFAPGRYIGVCQHTFRPDRMPRGDVPAQRCY